VSVSLLSLIPRARTESRGSDTHTHSLSGRGDPEIRTPLNQPSLFDDAPGAEGGARKNPSPEEDLAITSEAEVRELAREYFDLDPPDAEPPLLKARRQLRAQAAGAERRGLVARWAHYETATGHVSIHDPLEGEWHDVLWKDAPTWVRWEARRRRELYRAGDRRAYDLTAGEMEALWREEHPDEPEEGIVEDHPLEDMEDTE
jgi:hypothetical protein